MKRLKFITTSLIVGLLLVVGLLLGTIPSINAGVASLVGSKVQKESPLYIDGKKTDIAVIINGKSYVPVRSIGEAAGYKVGYDTGGIKLESVETSVDNSATETTTGGSSSNAGTTSSGRIFAYNSVEEYDKNLLIAKENIQDCEHMVSYIDERIKNVKEYPDSYEEGRLEKENAKREEAVKKLDAAKQRLNNLEKERAEFIAAGGK